MWESAYKRNGDRLDGFFKNCFQHSNLLAHGLSCGYLDYKDDEKCRYRQNKEKAVEWIEQHKR